MGAACGSTPLSLFLFIPSIYYVLPAAAVRTAQKKRRSRGSFQHVRKSVTGGRTRVTGGRTYIFTHRVFLRHQDAVRRRAARSLCGILHRAHEYSVGARHRVGQVFVAASVGQHDKSRRPRQRERRLGRREWARGGPPPGPPMPPAEMLIVAEQSFSPCFPCRSSWPHRRPPPGTCAIRIEARVAAAAGWGVPRGVSLPNFLERREGRRVRVRVRPRAPPSLPGYRGVDVLPFSET